jgi:hypothetical protein
LHAGFGRETLKERDHVGEINVDGRIILKWMVMKYGIAWTGFVCVRMWTCGGVLL